MEKINSIDEFNQKIDSSNIVVAVFRVEWCPDCHFITPFMDDVLDNFKDKLTAFNIDKDDFPTVAKEYDVTGIPSFVAFKNGKVIDSFISKQRKSRKEIEDFFTSL